MADPPLSSCPLPDEGEGSEHSEAGEGDWRTTLISSKKRPLQPLFLMSDEGLEPSTT